MYIVICKIIDLIFLFLLVAPITSTLINITNYHQVIIFGKSQSS